MKHIQFDRINFLLIAVSFVAAWLFPIELFLFSFMMLGPLHYLTELNWLSKRNFFLEGNSKNNLLYAAFFLLVLWLLHAANLNWFHIEGVNVVNYKLINGLLLACVVFSFPLAARQKGWIVVVIVGFCLAGGWWLSSIPLANLFLFSCLTTLTHVYLFTLLFLLVGSLKHLHFWGILNVLALIIGGIALLEIDPIILFLTQNEFLNKSGFGLFAHNLQQAFDQLQLASVSPENWMQFFAFIYTYHYLNWFSKTDVIGWAKGNKTRVWLMIFIWFVLVSVYVIDVQLGFYLAIILSVLHVVLEFPLNIHVMKKLLGAKVSD